MVRQLWKIVARQESFWVKWVNLVKLKEKGIWEVEANSSDSYGWKNMLALRDRIKSHVIHEARKGQIISMWYDKWDVRGPVDNIVPKRVRFEERLWDNMVVANMLVNGEWRWHITWYTRFLFLQTIAVPVLQNETKQVWLDLRTNGPKVPWYAFILWLIFCTMACYSEEIVNSGHIGSLAAQFEVAISLRIHLLQIVIKPTHKAKLKK
ncbi:hypothetical protein Tco_0218553 [Tanacetum coccineum]